MTTPELTFQAHLLARLNAAGRPTRFWRQNAGRFAARRKGGADTWVQGAPAGAADLVGLASPEGLHVEVECKGARTRRTDDQDRWQRHIERLGGVYLQVRYDEHQALEENVARCVAEVDAAIEARRARA